MQKYQWINRSVRLERRLHDGAIKLEAQYFVDMLQLLRERFGVEFVKGPTINIENPAKEIEIPEAHYAWPGSPVVKYERSSGVYNQDYRIEAVARIRENKFNVYMSFSNGSSNLVIGRKIEVDSPYPILARHLVNFSTMVASYYITQDSETRQALDKVAGSKVPANMLRGFGHTIVKGNVTPSGIESMVSLFLQDPNPKEVLRCYEVEVENRSNSDPLLGRVVPSSVYQPDEQHFCMTGAEYPLIPVDLSEVSKLTVLVNTGSRYWGGILRKISIPNFVSVAGEIPLSVDGTNHWYVKDDMKRGKLALLGAPKWKNSLWLVLDENYNSVVSPQHVYRRLTEFSNANNRVTKMLDSIKH